VKQLGHRDDIAPRLSRVRAVIARCWPRLSPRFIDAAVAVAVATVGGLGTLPVGRQHHELAVTAILVAMGLVLYTRRSFPGLVLTAVAVLTVCLLALRPASEAGFIAVLISSYSAAVYGSRRLAIGLAAAAALLLGADGIANAVGTGRWYHTSVPLHMLLAAAGAWVVGWIVRSQLAAKASQLDLLAERAALTAERQQDEARRVRVSERLRIARELHDIVAHHITVAVIQASGAQRIAERDPVRARQAMAESERTARSALDEMRRLLSLLRSDDAVDHAPRGSTASSECASGDQLNECDRAALPGIADIGSLAERVRAAGVEVTVAVTGQADQVPADIGLAAYRIVQEALTNVLKHAGNARATVRLDLTDGVEITVTDDGRGAASHLNGAVVRGAGIVGAGRGITGMAERAAAAGGRLTAGPRLGGGFEVHVLMPPGDS
jgi:signal transduction histidine kinase